MMNKKILIGSIFVALLIVSIPSVSTLHAQSVDEESTSMTVVATPTTSLEKVIELLSNEPSDSQFCDRLWDARARVAYYIDWFFDHNLKFMAVFLIYNIAWPLQIIYDTFCLE